MNEKIYHVMTKSGAASLVVGIIVMVTGIVSGIILVAHGANLLKTKKEVMF